MLHVSMETRPAQGRQRASCWAQDAWMVTLYYTKFTVWLVTQFVLTSYTQNAELLNPSGERTKSPVAHKDLTLENYDLDDCELTHMPDFKCHGAFAFETALEFTDFGAKEI